MRLLASLTTPGWITYGATILGFIIALGTAWKTVFNPVRKFANKAEEMYPLLVVLTETFADTPHAFSILDDIVAQFRTDSGSSLRDVVNRLETMATENSAMAELNRVAATALAVGVESARQLAIRDREELSRLLIQQDRTSAKIDAGLLALDILRGGQRDSRVMAEGVAEHLADSQARADAVHGVAGEAADAGAQSGPA